jgi:N-acetylneuraminic acid mutarotase
MQKLNSRSAFLNLRTLVALFVCAAACLIVTGTLLAFFRSETPTNVSQRTLTFADRVGYQRAIEDVYWRHRIWPKERRDAKPSLDSMMSQKQLEKRVADYLRKSQALEDYWRRPITADQLQAEMDRMATHTKQPEVLRELFDALGNDPFVIAECLARPALAERLLTNWYAHDQRIHGDLKKRAETELLAHPSVEQMKQLSGSYSEIELIRTDGGDGENRRPVEHGVQLNSHEWDQTVQKLAAIFGNRPVAAGSLRDESVRLADGSPAKAAALTQIKTEVLSALQEDEARFYATAVIDKTYEHLKLATVSWSKEPLEAWLARRENEVPSLMAAPNGAYTLANITGDACVDDTWTATAGSPDGRAYHTTVWTGSEMIVWGGQTGQSSYANTGGRYNPSTDTWAALSTANAPVARYLHTAVWTGTEMIVWGGRDAFPNYLNTGGRYNPTTDVWTGTSTTNAPDGRYDHTAVWDGREMIVWGGFQGSVAFNTGGKYNPSTDSWRATNTANAPDARAGHAAVWTGSQMIVWGGTIGPGIYFDTGGRYDPSTNSWVATSTANVPDPRAGHTAVWDGSEMIVWGGSGDSGTLNTGGKYNPSTDSWTGTSTTNAPNARTLQTAVWTSSEMIVWGGLGFSSYLNTGGRYDLRTPPARSASRRRT